jgi:hypothetical protein
MLRCTEIKNCRGSREFVFAISNADKQRRAVAQKIIGCNSKANCTRPKSLQRNVDRNPRAGIPAVVKVVAIVDVVYVDIVIVIPVISPIFRPRVDGTDPVALVLEARVSPYNPKGKSIDAEPMAGPKVSAVAVVRDAVAVVAATLLPGTMVRLPVL